MTSSMRAVKVEKPHTFHVADAPVPELGPDDVLIRVRAAGICGTDLHILAGEYEASYPLTPGHEFSGDVAAVGESVERLAVGDRVTADPNLPCNRCEPCQRNEQNQCVDLRAVGVTRDGGFAEYVSVPQSSVFPIGDLSYPAAAMVEPLACVIWGLKRVGLQPGDRVLVQGAGPMGCLIVQAVKRAGAAFVAATDTVPWRLDLAAKLGADAVATPQGVAADALRDAAPSGFDIVVDVTGIPAVVEGSIEHLRARGKLWLFGVCPPGSVVRLPPYELFRKDLTVIGSFALSKTFPESLAWVRSGRVQLEPLVSHRLPLEEFEQAVRVARHDPERMKVQLAI